MMLLLLPISATVIVLLAPLVPPLKSRGTRLLRIEGAAWLRIDGPCAGGSGWVGAGGWGSGPFKVPTVTARCGPSNGHAQCECGKPCNFAPVLRSGLRGVLSR